MNRATAVPVVINGAAGGGRSQDECNRLREIFSAVDLDVRVLPARSGAELVQIAGEIALTRPPLVIAGGGDGTISAVASALAGSDTRLGVLPLGTLNHFAKDLRIPLDTAEAVRTIAQGHSISIDVGEVNGRVFINNSSLGLYPQIVRHRDTLQRRLGHGKWPALVWASMSALRHSPFMNVRLSLDEDAQRYLTTFVFVGNNEYVMEGFNIGVRERLDGGRLSVYVSHRRGRGGLLLLALRALFKRLRQAKDFQALTSETLLVETRRRRLHVATDGEVSTMDTPLEYRIRRNALRVIVPQAAEQTP